MNAAGVCLATRTRFLAQREIARGASHTFVQDGISMRQSWRKRVGVEPTITLTVAPHCFILMRVAMLLLALISRIRFALTRFYHKEHSTLAKSRFHVKWADSGSIVTRNGR